MKRNNYKRNNYTIALISTITSFILISFSLIEINRTYTMGYEFSNYSATPSIFWISAVTGILNGIFLIILNIHDESKKIWILGLFEIIFCESLLLIVYALRGYIYLERGDTLTYIGMAHDINIYNYVLEYNFYPLISLLISQVNQITNIPILHISYILPAIFHVFFILFIYCWAKSLYSNKTFIFCTLISSTPLFFAYYSTTIFHMLLAVYTLPLLFYIIQKRHDSRFRILEVVLFIAYVFFHPIVSAFILVYLIAYLLSERYIYDSEVKIVSRNELLIFFVALIFWFITQKVLFRDFSNILLTILGEFETTSTYTATKYYASRLWSIDSIIHIIIPIFDDIVYYILFIISAYLIADKKNTINKENFFGVIFGFIFGNLFLGFMFLSANIHNPVRLITLNQNVIFTIPIVGYLIYYMFTKKYYSKLSVILLIVLIAQVLSLFSIYQSPIIMLPNDQITKSEIEGMDWFINEKNTEYVTSNIMSPVSRFSDFKYGHQYIAERKDLYRDLNLEEHFGFSDEPIFPTNLTKYLVITEYDIQAYTKVWNETNKFNEEDFTKVNSCINVDKIYQNKGFTAYQIHKMDKINSSC